MFCGATESSSDAAIQEHACEAGRPPSGYEQPDFKVCATLCVTPMQLHYDSAWDCANLDRAFGNSFMFATYASLTCIC